MGRCWASVSVLGALCAAALSSGCTVGALEPTEEDGEVGETSEAVLRANATREAPWSVHLEGDTNCTAEALTKHWLITAAHCLFGKTEVGPRTVTAVNPTSGAESIVFSGSGRFIIHPNYNHTSSTRVHDFALVELDGDGMNLPSFVRLYNDAREPWVKGFTGNRDFEVAGFGFGSNPGGASECDAGALGTKRLGTAFRLNGLNQEPIFQGPMKVTGLYTGEQQLCDGDSGSPWMFRRGHTLMQFAVHSGSRGAIGGQKAATLVRPKLDFIRQETASRGRPIECFQDTKDGYAFLSCQDRHARVVAEAESGQLVAPMTIGNSGNASSAKFVSLPTNTTTGGSSRLTVNLSQSGHYFVWVRVLSPSSTLNAGTVSVDGSAPRELRVDVNATPSYQWVPVSLANIPTAFNLGAGPHSVVLGRGLAGTQLDQVLLTTDPNYVPFESFVEAESGTIVAPMAFVRGLPTVVSSTYGSGFIRTPNGSGPGGVAIYNFNVTLRSDYVVWGRTSATAPEHDSFKVMFDADSDNDDWAWQTPSGTGWQWSAISGTGKGRIRVMLDAGAHWMAVKRDEAGTALDRLLITNNPGFIPADPPFSGPILQPLTPSSGGVSTGTVGGGVAVGGFAKLQ